MSADGISTRAARIATNIAPASDKSGNEANSVIPSFYRSSAARIQRKYGHANQHAIARTIEAGIAAAIRNWILSRRVRALHSIPPTPISQRARAPIQPIGFCSNGGGMASF